MPQFILICHDRPDSFELRAETRAAHLGHIKSIGARVLLAGPMLDEEGRPNGSVLIIEADNLTEAHEFAKNDPYAKAGLFKEVEVRPYKIVVGQL